VLGFPAIATTSCGIANCLGNAEGENIPLDEMLFIIKRIVNAVDVPVTADIEAGYSNDMEELSHTIASVERLHNTIDRAHHYKAAGADCVFIPGVADERVISSLVKNIPGPINILGVANTPPTEVLEKLGVAHVSTGSGPARACATLARRIGRELIHQGTYSSFTHDAMTYKEMNNLFSER